MRHFDQLLSDIRAQEPTAAEIEQSSARVRQRLFPAPQAHSADCPARLPAPFAIAQVSPNFSPPRSPVLSMPGVSFFSTRTFASASNAADPLTASVREPRASSSCRAPFNAA